MLAVKGTKLSDNLSLNISKHRSEREASVSDLAGPWQLHMYPSEDSKRQLAHATQSCKNSNQTIETCRVRTLVHWVMTAERSHTAVVLSSDENLPLHRVYID